MSGTQTYTVDAYVLVNGDTTAEPTESLIIELFDAVNGEIASKSIRGLISNDDAPVVYLEGAADVEEGDSGTTDLTFRVRMFPAHDQAITVSYALSGTATEGDDYESHAVKSLTISARGTQGNILVTVIGDQVYEPDEIVQVALVGIVGSTGVAIAEGRESTTAKILNDDDPPEFTIDSPSVAEGASGASTPLEFTVTRHGTATPLASVQYTVSGAGNAVPDLDYEPLADGTLTFSASDTTKTIEIMVIGDGFLEDAETVQVMLFNPAGAIIRLGEGAGTGTITNDDTMPFFTVNQPSVVEGAAGTMTVLDFVVTIASAWTRQVTVEYRVTDGTGAGEATAGEDFTSTSGILTFASASAGVAGETEKTASVTVLGDDFDEFDKETVTLTLFNAMSNARIHRPNWTGSIADDDARPVYSIDSPAIDEGASGTASLVFTITKEGATRLGTAVTYTVAGGTATGGPGVDADYEPVPRDQLRFGPDEDKREVTVQVKRGRPCRVRRDGDGHPVRFDLVNH